MWAAARSAQGSAHQLAWSPLVVRSNTGEAEEPSSSRIFIPHVSVMVLFPQVLTLPRRTLAEMAWSWSGVPPYIVITCRWGGVREES